MAALISGSFISLVGQIELVNPRSRSGALKSPLRPLKGLDQGEGVWG